MLARMAAKTLFELPYDAKWRLERRFFLDVEHRYTKTHRMLLQAVGDLKGKSVLDLGCSRGMLLERFRGYGDVTLVGVELDATDGAEAEARGVHVDRVQINVYEDDQITARLPYEDESFDVIVAAEIIEHIVDTGSFVRETFRVVRPGGFVFFSTPNILWWRYRLDLLLGRYPDPLEHRLHYGTDFGHVRIFTPRLLRELVAEAGFDVVKIAGKRIGSIGMLARAPRPLALVLDDLATRWPSVTDDVMLVAGKPLAV